MWRREAAGRRRQEAAKVQARTYSNSCTTLRAAVLPCLSSVPGEIRRDDFRVLCKVKMMPRGENGATAKLARDEKIPAMTLEQRTEFNKTDV